MLTFKQYVYVASFIILSLIEVTLQKCSQHSDCPNNSYCCTVHFHPLWKICRDNCVDNLCKSNNDCGGSQECCTYSNKCTRWKRDCDCRLSNVCPKMNLHCCKQRRLQQKGVCRRDCIDETCHEDQDCAPNECCSRSYKCTRNKMTCLDVCNTNSGCLNGIRPYCCGHRYDIRYCSNTCLGWKCKSDSDCGEPQQCCIDNYCSHSKCTDEFSSWKLVIISASVVGMIILCTIIVIICYRRRMGRCVLLQPRTREESMELRNQRGEEPRECIPPPPYSIQDQPFPAARNTEFPPIYSSRDLVTCTAS